MVKFTALDFKRKPWFNTKPMSEDIWRLSFFLKCDARTFDEENRS